MHNHNGGKNSGMMWMMLICCALPLIVLLFVGGTVSSIGGYFWPILIGAFVVMHIWTMFRGHGGKNEKL